MTASIRLDVARLDVDAAEESQCLAMLDEQERARAAAFRFERDRRRFVVRRARLRTVLGKIVGEAPDRIVLIAGSHGKPALPAGAPHFSASHSGDLMMIAVGDVPVGCDIERIDPDLDWRPLANRFFSPAEQTALRATPKAAATRAFFDCWTRKEALVKGLGLGLSHPLDTFDVAVGRDPDVATSEAGWTIRDAVPAPGFAGAIATQAHLA